MSSSGPIATRVRNLRRTVSIGVAVLVVTATVVPVASAASSDVPPPDKTALVLGGTTVPTPDQAYLDAVRDHFVAPTQPGEVKYVAVTAPMEAWPITGAVRLIWLFLGPQSVWGFSGPAWPDEPLWKLSGFFDVTFDQSIQGGVTALETAMADNGNNHLVINGYSQGAMVANIEKQKLADQYPVGTTAPDISFVLIGDPNVPNGGIAARFPGLYVPILDVTLNGPAPTDTQFHTVDIIRQYDGAADFPLYPLNLVSTANALLGGLYLHPYDLDPSLADPATPAIHTKTGDTDYYFFETENLPLFQPLRDVGVPEPVIDVVEPVARWAVGLGYDRSIPPGEPTPARLIPMHDPVTVGTDLVEAVGEGINNALALTGSAPLLKVPAPDTSADTNGGGVFGSPGKVLDRNAFRDGIDNSLSALNPLRTDQGNKQAGTDAANSRPQTPPGRWARLTPKSLTDGFKFAPLKPGSAKADNQTGGPLAQVGANVGDSFQQVGKNVDKTIKKATDSVTKGFSGFKGHKVGSKADDIPSRVR
jgi:PE-PPE domain